MTNNRKFGFPFAWSLTPLTTDSWSKILSGDLRETQSAGGRANDINNYSNNACLTTPGGGQLLPWFTDREYRGTVTYSGSLRQQT